MVVRSFLSRGCGVARLRAAAPRRDRAPGRQLRITPLLRHFWPLIVVSGFMGASLGFTQPLTMRLMVESVITEF